MIKTTIFVFVLLISFGVMDVALSNDRHYQRLYTEKVYEPIPPKFQKLTLRLAEWNKDAEAELEILQNSNNPKVVRWLRKIKALKNIEGLELLEEINRITNEAVFYIDDYHHYNKGDYWAPPIETLTEGGDCEDIALLKVVALYLHGWDVKERAHILIGIINYNGKQTPHAVLEIDRGDGVYHVMRSITDDVPTFDKMDKIMKPIYMISSKNLVVFDAENKQHLAYNLSGYTGISTAVGKRKPHYND